MFQHHGIARLLLCAGLAAHAAGAHAQDRPVVFVHGLGSNPATWDAAVSVLTPQLAIAPLQASLQWQSFYESQVSELEQELGAQVPGNGIAVGHSNGGVVSRQWTRVHDLGGLITIGSPNQGAPIVDHIFDWLAYLDDVLYRMSAVANIFATDVDWDKWWWVPQQWKGAFAFAVDTWNTAGNGLLSLGFDYRLPVMSEMRVASSFMANLNSGVNRDREAAEVGARVAIVNVARDFYDGGPFRTLSPNYYADWHYGLNIAGVVLDALAAVIYYTADIDDLGAFSLADHIFSVAAWFLQLEEVWCRSVSDPSPLAIGRCYHHDGMVPAWSQAYDTPRLSLIVNVDGPIHTKETAEAIPLVFDALTTIAGIPPRPPASEPAPSPAPTPSPTPDPTPSPTPAPTPTGRYKLNGGQCYWDPYDSGPNQCNPSAPTGRYKVDSFGTCYFEPSEYPPDQCTPPPQPTGRYKLQPTGCVWDPNDSGPNQCVP
jgi:pimeloyl-ACP methyl ester carboxylesterase